MGEGGGVELGMSSLKISRDVNQLSYKVLHNVSANLVCELSITTINPMHI